MNISELIKHCQQQIDLHGAEDAEAMIVMRGRWGKRDYKTLLGVRGEIIQEFPHGIGVMFPAQKLLDAAIKENLRLLGQADVKSR